MSMKRAAILILVLFLLSGCLSPLEAIETGKALVAAVSSSALLQTTSSLQEQAIAVGKEAKAEKEKGVEIEQNGEVGNYSLLTDAIIGRYDNNQMINLGINLVVSDESDPIELSELMLKFSVDDGEPIIASFNPELAEKNTFEDLSESIESASSEGYGVFWEGKDSEYSSFELNASDEITVFYNNQPLNPGQEIHVEFEYKGTVIVEVYAPIFEQSGNFVQLFP